MPMIELDVLWSNNRGHDLEMLSDAYLSKLILVSFKNLHREAPLVF